MKVLIVEDEINAADKLTGMLSRIDAHVTVLDVCVSVASTTSWMQNNQSPDLIFMDIQLTDGLSFEVFKNVEITCPTIFITAFDNFAIQAFKVNSIDYILKPYSLDEVAYALEKHKNYHTKSAIVYGEQLYMDLTQALTANYKTRFYTKLNNSVYSIKTQDVLYIKFEDKSTLLLDNANRKYVIDYSLDTLEGLLDPSQFFRINRQYIISFKSIVKMEISAKNRINVKLHGLHEKELVSRAKTSDFKIWLDQ